MIRPFKIVYLITELDTGGAQAALYRLIKHLDRSRFTPVVACFYNGDRTYGRLIQNLGIHTIDLSTQKRKWRIDAFFRLYRLLRQERPDVLHTWLFHANVVGRFLGKLAGVPVIISSERNIHLSNPFRDLLSRITAPLAQRITCVSQSVADHVVHEIGLPKDKILVIPNGIDLHEFSGLPDQKATRLRYDLPKDHLLIGSVGRLHPVKNYDLLIRVFAYMQVQYPLTHLVIIGDGPLRNALETLCLDLGLSIGNQVTFLGDQREIPKLLSTLDIFVLPSKYEGMPNAVLEAMAAGLPTISTASGGTQEIILDGINGLLIPADNPGALQQSIEKLLSDAQLRSRLGKAAHLHIKENFTLGRTVELTTSLYEDLIRINLRERS